MRDREATSRQIVHALGRVLARDGFRAVGLRAVAREAGVDKRLIYRYFGGLTGLMRAYATGEDFWWTVDELIGDDLPRPKEETAAGWMALAVKRHLLAIRARPLTQEILVWELIERNALTDELAAVREKRAGELLRRLGEKNRRISPRTWAAVGALLGAGATYLVLRSRTYDFYAGIDLRSERDWKDLERTIDSTANAVDLLGGPTRGERHGKRASGARKRDRPPLSRRNV